MPLPEKHPPTAEQQAIVDAASDASHPDLEVQAGAGAGKTNTLGRIAKAMPNRKGVAITYNKKIADDMQKNFPLDLRASTAHSLAWQAIIKPNSQLHERLDDDTRLPTKEAVRRLGVETIDLDGKKIPPFQVVRLALEGVVNFCKSDADKPMPEHMPILDKVDDDQQEEFDAQVLKYARKAWADLSSNTGRLFFSHDHYLKLYQLSKPYIRASYICVDEGQDLNPVMASIVAQQGDTQKIVVGDSNQAINGWNGAIDAMNKFGGRRMFLSQSFRFGQPIADEANKWLTLLKSDLRLSGFDAVQSMIIDGTEPVRAILTRTNAAALAEAIKVIAAGKKVHIIGGVKELRRLAEAAGQLKAGEPTDHPALFMFENWAELREYVDEDATGADLKVMVNLIDTYGPGTILHTCNRVVDENFADTIVSTAHKSKGCEWPTVRIGPDFGLKLDRDSVAIPPTKEDLMLAYVAVTRAKVMLDPGGLSWINANNDPRISTEEALLKVAAEGKAG